MTVGHIQKHNCKPNSKQIYEHTPLNFIADNLLASSCNFITIITHSTIKHALEVELQDFCSFQVKLH